MVLENSQFWVVDVEGNGGSPPEIVELAMVEVDGLLLGRNPRHWLIKPQQPIASVVSRIHGLTDADVANAPSIEDLADDILMRIEDTPIVGHNVRVEVDILTRSLPGWMPRIAIDTVVLARSVIPGLSSYSLGKIGKYLGLEEEATGRTGGRHHAALFDATLTALIFIDLLRRTPSDQRRALLKDADILNSKQGSFL